MAKRVVIAGILGGLVMFFWLFVVHEFLLAREGALNLLEGLLAAWLLSWAAAGRGYVARVVFVTVAGILASIRTNLEYWNWYAFPSVYVRGYLLTQITGYFVVGLIVAAFVKSEIDVRS